MLFRSLFIPQHASNGQDLLNAGGIDKIDATSTLTFQPFINGSESVVPIIGDLWLAVSNNAVNAAIFTVELHLIKIGGAR